MSQLAEEKPGQAAHDSEMVDGVAPMELWHGSKEDAEDDAEVRGIVAEAIDAWLSSTSEASFEETAEVREARALALL
ncbi:MAG: hypothetical protein M3410_09475, partial [Acidobacteriota bacterium]|nr:hypothetical protein [Acidobacteriota bacterium]